MIAESSVQLAKLVGPDLFLVRTLTELFDRLTTMRCDSAPGKADSILSSYPIVRTTATKTSLHARGFG